MPPKACFSTRTFSILFTGMRWQTSIPEDWAVPHNGGRTFCRIQRQLLAETMRGGMETAYDLGRCSGLADFARHVRRRVPCSTPGSVSACRATRQLRPRCKKKPLEAIRKSLVAKRFDRVQVCRAYRRKHSAHYADECQNGHRDQQDVGRDHQPDITGVCMLGHRTVERQRSDRKRHQIRQ